MQKGLIYSFLFFVILYDILRILLGIVGIYYINTFLFVLCFIIIYTKGKKIFFKLPSMIWLIWVVYSFINWKLSGLSTGGNELFFVSTRFCIPICTMWIVGYIGLKAGYIGQKYILFLFAAYVFCGLLLQKGGTGTGVGWDARGGATLGNSLPLNAVSLAFYACMCNISKNINKRTMIVLLILAIGAVLFVATRKALIALFLIIFFYVLSYIDFKKAGNIIIVALSFVIISIVGYYILNYTQIGLRFTTIEDQSSNVSMNNNVPFYLKFLGDRAAQYLLAWDLFLEHPLTGVGVNNFSIITGYPLVLHSEYMVQLCENGIIGFILFCIFNISILLLVFKMYKQGLKGKAFVCFGGVLAIWFIDFTSWTYDSPYYFAMYGIVLAHCNSVEFKNK